MAMEETAYAVGSIVWVKVTGGKWWPGEVVSADSCPDEVTKGLKKDPLAIVKYFDEDYYELVKIHSHIQPFACSKRKDFIKKGRELLKHDPNLDKFDKDVAEAEKLCGTYDLFSLEDRNISPLGNHGDFPRAEHNHGSALVSSSLPPPPPPPKPNAPSVHLESLLSDANDSRTNASGATNDSFVGTPKDVRIRTQESPSCMISPLSAGNGSFGPYSCDVCGFQTSRIANIIIHHKSHTEHHLHSWPSINSSSPKSTTTTTTQQQSVKKSKKAHSDGKLVNKQKQKPTASSSALQKLKRKLVDSGGGGADGDGKAKRKKTSMSKPEEVKSFQASLQSGDAVHVVQATKTKVTKVTDEKKQKEPKKKATKKKEDDSDAVFEKIKKLGMKRMNRKRGRSSFMSMGPSTSPLKSFKRDDVSDESSDEGEFLIMREDINSKEEEQDEEGKFADENDRSDEAAIVEDKDKETEEIVTPDDEQLAEENSAQEKLPDAEDNNNVAADVAAATAGVESIHVDELSSVDRSLSETVAPTVSEPDKEDAASSAATAEEIDVEGEVEIEEHGSGVEQVAAAPIMAPEVNGLASSAEDENYVAEKKANDSCDYQEILQIPLPSVIGTSMSGGGASTINSYDVANSDHSYDSNKMLDTSNNVDTYDFVDDPADCASPPPTREVSGGGVEGDLPPLPPPLPPTPPPPPPPPSPPANDYAMSTAAAAAAAANVIIDPGDIPLPPSKVPEPPSAAASTSSLIIEEPPLEYTKLETLVQPPDMALPSDDVYDDVVDDDVVSVAVTEIPPMVDNNEIIQIGNEQVIDTSMDVFCNEIVIESDDKPPGVEGVIEYEDICLLADDKTKLLENNSVVCDAAAQLISAASTAAAAAENGLTKDLDPPTS